MSNRTDLRKSPGQEFFDLIGGAAGATASYNLAGILSESLNYSDNLEKFLTAGVLTAGTILGYKTRTIAKKCSRKLRKANARTEFLQELETDNTNFLERQGVKRGPSGRIGRGLKYLLTVPAGGALGYLPGKIGIIPLCAYFGERYNWKEAQALDSGPIAGALIGAYAFTELTKRGNSQKITTAGSAMAGAGLFYLVAKNATGEMGLWPWLATAAFCSTITGTMGYITHRKFSTAHSKKLSESQNAQSTQSPPHPQN